MPKRAESTVNRVVRHLATAGGSGILGDVSRRLGLCGILARALKTDPALIQFVALDAVRNKTSHRTQTRLTLTALGIAYAQTLKPGWKPARLSLADWQAQLTEMTQERFPAALQIARDTEDGTRWRRQESERKARDRAAEAKRTAREKPEPKQPSAGRVRSDEENEARAEWARGKGFKPAYDDSDEKPTQEGIAAACRKSAQAHTFRPAFTSKQITPPAPRTPQEKYLAALRQPPPPPTLEQMEARRLEAERRQRDCLICQTGVDPNFLMHDPATHLAYLGTK